MKFEQEAKMSAKLKTKTVHLHMRCESKYYLLEPHLFDVSIADISIILVEPSSTQRKLIVNSLDESGVREIEAVKTGEIALERIAASYPDLVISSMYLEDMTGTDLVTHMRNNFDLKDIPFMLISSEKRFKLLDPIRQAGVVAILPKPFHHSDLQRALDSTLDFVRPEELVLKNVDISQLKVMVVDDSRMARRHIQRVLGDMGIENITMAENGREAVRLFDESAFDLIVTDLNMPEMDGNELVNYIRQQSDHPDTPVMMVTSEDNNARLANIEQSGVSAICDKPFEPADVRNTLMRVLGG